jgi:hypothetical protein
MSYADRLPLKLQEARGANISRGRNLAVQRATGEVIASTDAGVHLEPDWLQKLISPFEALDDETLGSSAHAVAGFFLPDPQTSFELALGATTLPLARDVDPSRFLPSSRSVAFTRAAFDCSDGYPEWLDYCEDLIFDFRLIECCGGFAWAPEAVAHFRPRAGLRSFFKQYYRYARGDGKADLWRKRHAIRYVIYLIALPALLLLIAFHSPWWLVVLLAGVIAYSRTPFRRLRPHLAGLTPVEKIKAILLIPLIRGVGDVAKMAGYPAGWVWRIRNWQRSEIHWRKP